MFVRVFTAVLLLALLPGPTHANIVDLDIDFTTTPLGSSLQRRGANFGEPVPGAFDATTDEIISSGGNRKVQIVDTANPNPELLYWALYDDRQIDTGILVLECSFNTSDLARSGLLVVGKDDATDLFFNLVLEANGDLAYLDAATPAPTVFDTYIPRNDLDVRLEFNLDTGTYDFELNGTTIFTNKSHGVPGALERMILGFSAGTTGVAMVQDDLFAYRTIGDSELLLFAGFNNKPLGPIGTGGAIVNEPFIVPPAGANVVLGGFPSKSLQICHDPVENSTVWFRFLNSAEVTQGSMCVGVSLRFDTVGDYIMLLGQPTGSQQDFSRLIFAPDGTISLLDESGTLNDIANYTNNTRIDFRWGVRLDAGVSYLWINEQLILKGRDYGNVDGRGIGSLIISIQDADAGGCVRMDDIFAVRVGDPVTSTPELATRPPAPELMPASPNPFNPSTQLSFELPRASAASCAFTTSRGDGSRRW